MVAFYALLLMVYKLRGFFVLEKCSNVTDSTIETNLLTGLRSAVGNVSGNRCESDCRSKGREFDPGPVPYFRGD